MSIHYSLNHQINVQSSNLFFWAKLSGKTRMIRTYAGSSGPNLLRKSGWSGHAPDHPAEAPGPFWSSPDDPALSRINRPWHWNYIKARGGGIPNPISFLSRRTLCSPNSSRGVLDYQPRICGAILCLWFSTSRKIRTPRKLFNSRPDLLM